MIVGAGAGPCVVFAVGARMNHTDRKADGTIDGRDDWGAYTVDGAALRQVLTPANFAKVQPGMAMEDLRKLLGKPARRTPYPLKNETAWEWRWVQPPNSPMVFIATLNDDQRVVSAGSSPDRSTEANAN